VTVAGPKAPGRQPVDERVHALCAAAVRAISGVSDVRFRGDVLHRAGSPVPATAPHLRPTPGRDDFPCFRGASDGVALRLLHSDSGVHARHRPQGQVPRLVFEMLEQFRVESLADPRQPGVLANLRHRHRAWSRQFHASGLTESDPGLLLYAVALVSRARVTGDPVDPAADDVVESARYALAPVIGAELARLRPLRSQQARYAVPARSLAEKVGELVDAALAGEPQRSAAQGRGLRTSFTLLADETDADDGAGADPKSAREAAVAGATGYRVFTRAYDSEQDMRELTRPAQLAQHRDRLDALVARSGANPGRLARQLRLLLGHDEPDGWDTAQEEGVVDGRLLARLVTGAGDRRLFRSPREQPTPSSAVAFLLDCSGSMRRHQEQVAVLVDVLSRALDLADVGNEVLGFTTAAWNGGRAMRDWRRAGRPPAPGRLNEVLHLVVKDAATPWRRARPGIAGLLRPDLYREGVDGEAVEWACTRLRHIDADRRYLLVVSDGSPMDGATHLANGERYLDRHLSDVVAAQAATGEVTILGLGAGVDLSSSYTHSHALSADAPVGRDTFREVLALLATAVARSPRAGR
jgi:cobaltochelatase CobT